MRRWLTRGWGQFIWRGEPSTGWLITNGFTMALYFGTSFDLLLDHDWGNAAVWYFGATLFGSRLLTGLSRRVNPELEGNNGRTE